MKRLLTSALINLELADTVCSPVTYFHPMASSFLNTIHQSNYNNLKVNLNCVYISIVRTHEYCFIWQKEPCKDGYGGTHLKSQHLGG